MDFFHSITFDIQVYLREHPDIPKELAIANLYSLRMRDFDLKYNKNAVKELLLKGKNVNENQFFSDEEIEKNIERVKKFYYEMIRMQVQRETDPRLDSETAFFDDGNYILPSLMLQRAMKYDGTADGIRYNKRIREKWSTGAVSDRTDVIQELLAEIDNIDMSKWNNKGVNYIMEHISEYYRDINLLTVAENIYSDACNNGYLTMEPEIYERYKNISHKASIDYIRVDDKITMAINPVGCLIQLSQLESYNIFPDFTQDEIKKWNDAKKYHDIELMRGRYERFLSICSKKNIPVPTNLKDYKDNYVSRYKDIEPETSFAYYEALEKKEKEDKFPWETEVFQKGLEANKNYSQNFVENINAKKLSADYIRRHDMLGGEAAAITNDKYFNKGDTATFNKSILKYNELINSIKASLGYRESDPMPMVIGGEGNGNTVFPEDAFERLSDIPDGTAVYATDKYSGAVKKFIIEHKMFGTIKLGAGLLLDANEGEIAELRSNQCRVLGEKLNRLIPSRAFDGLGANGVELTDTINSINLLLRSNINDNNERQLNNLISQLVIHSSNMYNSLLQKSQNTLLSDNEGKALAISEQLREIGIHSCIGVPGDRSSFVERMKLGTNLSEPSYTEVLEKMTKLCKTFKSTCSGFRNDSDEFKFLYNSAKILRDQLKYAQDHGMRIDQENLTEGYRRIFTAAEKYMGHRKDMTTKNSRTQTRLSCAKDILEMGRLLGCRRLTGAELLAHTMVDHTIRNRIDGFVKTPNPQDEAKLAEYLSKRKEQNSILYNHKVYQSMLEGMAEEEIIKCAGSDDKRQKLIIEFSAADKKQREAADRPQAANSNLLYKDTALYKANITALKETMAFEQKLIKQASEISLPQKMIITIANNCMKRLVLEELRRLGEERATGDLNKTIADIKKKYDEEVLAKVKNTTIYKSLINRIKTIEMKHNSVDGNKRVEINASVEYINEICRDICYEVNGRLNKDVFKPIADIIAESKPLVKSCESRTMKSLSPENILEYFRNKLQHTEFLALGNKKFNDDVDTNLIGKIVEKYDVDNGYMVDKIQASKAYRSTINLVNNLPRGTKFTLAMLNTAGDALEQELLSPDIIKRAALDDFVVIDSEVVPDNNIIINNNGDGLRAEPAMEAAMNEPKNEPQEQVGSSIKKL